MMKLNIISEYCFLLFLEGRNKALGSLFQDFEDMNISLLHYSRLQRLDFPAVGEQD